MFNEEQNKEIKSGLIILQILVLVLFFLIGLRLWYFQIYKGELFADKAQDNIVRQQSIHAPRGLIKDRHGALLAKNKPAYSLAMIREDCENHDQALQQISDWTGRDLELLQNKFARDRQNIKPFARQIIAPNLDFKEMALIESQLMNWPGLQIVPEPLRAYPHGPLLAPVLGYVAQANKSELRANPDLRLGDNIGKKGLERVFDRQLRGSKGLKQLEVNAQGRTLQENILRQPEPGEDIKTSIDLELQKVAWEQLQDRTGALVVLDPDTGEILAMVSRPSFDNNLFVQGITSSDWQMLMTDAQHPLLNRCVQTTYPPASVFKLILAANALEQDAVHPDDTSFCSGRHRVGNRVFRCWREHGHGRVDLQEALKKSCDVYFYKLGQELGVEKISEFARQYGFHAPTGINLTNENQGTIPDPEWKLRRTGERWQGGDTVNLSIGQGYTQVTPLQIARFYGALVNGGYLLRPQLLPDPEPEVQEKLPLADKDLQFLRQAMVATVEKPEGTARRLQTPEAKIGGKTGTAQVVALREEYREKDQEEVPYGFRHHAWMASFGEQGDQSYVVVALVEHGGMGGSTAGPIVKSIYDHLFMENGSELKLPSDN